MAVNFLVQTIKCIGRHIFFAHKDIKYLISKVGYFSKISLSWAAQTAQRVKSMFSNVAYRANVYKTGADKLATNLHL